MTEILNGVALCVVLDFYSAYRIKAVTPYGVVGVSLTVFRQDIAVGVVGHTVDHITVMAFGKKLTKRVVGILSSTVYAIYDLRNSFLGIVLIRERSAIRKQNTADKLGCRRGFELAVFGVFVGYFTLVVIKLAGKEARAEL